MYEFIILFSSINYCYRNFQRKNFHVFSEVVGINLALENIQRQNLGVFEGFEEIIATKNLNFFEICILFLEFQKNTNGIYVENNFQKYQT